MNNLFFFVTFGFNLKTEKMKKMLLLFISILLLSCTDKEKIQKEIDTLVKENLTLMEMQQGIYKTNMELINIKKNFRIMSKNEEEDKDIIEISNELKNNKKRVIEFQKDIDTNRDKILELQKRLE